MAKLSWGARVSPVFSQKTMAICKDLGFDPSFLMACMAFESGETFSPSIRNEAGSGAVGLIQFMPRECAILGMTVDKMAALTAEEQLDYVAKYFQPFKGRLRDLGDVYGAIFWPEMIGKPPSWPIFKKDDKHYPKRYAENAGLDLNKDGEITKIEIVQRLSDELEKGYLPGNVWEFL